jgi:adenosine deaminase
MIDMSLPLCELHRHLDGAIRLQTILDLADQHGLELPAHTLEGIAPYVHIDQVEPNLMAFLARFKYLVEVLVDEDACRRVAYENVLDAHNEGVNYVELRFSPWFMGERHGIDAQAVMEACIDGVKAGERETDTQAKVIGILSRTNGVETCHKELDAILACKSDVIAVDLAGDEAGFPPQLFVEHFRKVRDAGLHVTIHAGEADGPHGVWTAIRDLGAERIGHGFRSIEDPKLVEYLLKHDIGLEICPTSNVHTTTVSSYKTHPVKSLADQGVKFCLNTDDPGISNITIAHEYEIAAPATGLSQAQISKSQSDAIEMAFAFRG